MNAENELEQLRSTLDFIDEHLLDTLKSRIECCVQIAQYKRAQAIPMMQTQRITAVQEHAARYAVRHGLNPAFLRRLYEVIIAETCRIEDLVIEGPARE